MRQRPLQGIRVLDLSRLLPGPYLTMILADMGADVVKIEAPGMGDYMRAIPPLQGAMSGRFLAVNRDKRSAVLDLKQDAGVRALLRMVGTADVVVESFRPGVMDRLGLGYERLCEHNPAVVLCSISGYGQTGPYRHRAGHDLNYIGTAGVLAMGGSAGGPPGMPGVQTADLAGGALWGATGILGALVGRQQTGTGTHLDISMTEGALALMAAELGNLACAGEAPSRGTATLNGGLACYQVYRCRDGGYLSVGALEPKFWAVLNQAIGRSGHPGEIVESDQDSIRAELTSIFATRTRADWVALFMDHDCCVDAVLELDELAEHPQHRARQVFFTIDDPRLGRVSQTRLPVGAATGAHAGPAHGEHTAEVLQEYGFSDEEIAALS